VAEVQRRLSPPECLNASLLGGVLRRYAAAWPVLVTFMKVLLFSPMCVLWDCSQMRTMRSSEPLIKLQLFKKPTALNPNGLWKSALLWCLVWGAVPLPALPAALLLCVTADFVSNCSWCSPVPVTNHLPWNDIWIQSHDLVLSLQRCSVCLGFFLFCFWTPFGFWLLYSCWFQQCSLTRFDCDLCCVSSRLVCSKAFKSRSLGKSLLFILPPVEPYWMSVTGISHLYLKKKKVSWR